MVKVALITFFILCSDIVPGQETNISERIISIAEKLAADESDPGVAEQFSERLFELIEDPVMINLGDEKEKHSHAIEIPLVCFSDPPSYY